MASGEYVAHIPRRIYESDLNEVAEACPGSECTVDRTTISHFLVSANQEGGVTMNYIPDDEEVNKTLPKPTVTSHDAAAFWGSAQNVFYSTEERLQLALAALEFFGGYYESHEDIEFEPTRWCRVLDKDGKIYAESSDEEEIREAAKEIGQTPQRLYEKKIMASEWRDI